MAELTFVGAAGTVTGSKHLLTYGGAHVYIDCGLFQGTHATTQLNDVPLPIPPAQTNAIVITHGHIDHVGYLPKIVRDGYRGPIYCTPATAGLIEIVLEDAAHLQRHFARRGLDNERAQHIPAFYDESDVQATLPLLHTVPLETEFTVEGATMRYRNAAHILGSAFVEATIEGRRVVFSGDLGRYGRPLLYDPAAIDPADVVVCESTYGDRDHPPDALGDLERILVEGVGRGGVIVIPAFAVERTQDILYAIGQLQRRNAALAPVPVHVDSPMAIKVDALFAQFPDAHKPMPGGGTLGCANVTVHVSTDESKALNDVTGPAIIIASSGMASGGRVLHHLHRLVSDPRSTLVFPGFQGPGTLGNALVHGSPTAKIYGDTLQVRATIANPSGFSAHADRGEILRWLGTLTTKPRFFAVHGDPPAAAALSATVHDKLGFDAAPAARGTTVTL